MGLRVDNLSVSLSTGVCVHPCAYIRISVYMYKYVFVSSPPYSSHCDFVEISLRAGHTQEQYRFQLFSRSVESKPYIEIST